MALWSISISPEGWNDILEELARQDTEFLRKANNEAARQAGKFERQIPARHLWGSDDLAEFCLSWIQDNNTCEAGGYEYYIDRDGGYSISIEDTPYIEFNFRDVPGVYREDGYETADLFYTSDPENTEANWDIDFSMEEAMKGINPDKVRSFYGGSDFIPPCFSEKWPEAFAEEIAERETKARPIDPEGNPPFYTEKKYLPRQVYQ